MPVPHLKSDPTMPAVKKPALLVKVVPTCVNVIAPLETLVGFVPPPTIKFVKLPAGVTWLALGL